MKQLFVPLVLCLICVSVGFFLGRYLIIDVGKAMASTVKLDPMFKKINIVHNGKSINLYINGVKQDHIAVGGETWSYGFWIDGRVRNHRAAQYGEWTRGVLKEEYIQKIFKEESLLWLDRDKTLEMQKSQLEAMGVENPYLSTHEVLNAIIKK